MIDLNKEAKNLADNESLFRDGLLTLCNKKLFIKGAIAGANSKYVKQQILQAQIDVINNLEFNPRKDLIDFILSVNNKIIELQQKLKQLEDE